MQFFTFIVAIAPDSSLDVGQVEGLRLLGLMHRCLDPGFWGKIPAPQAYLP
ncbi:hypothetical protein K9N68_18685 [Kovacikia minuta CCNUW1]|uniref:hypothetical protein n=1 Tax=Kovacikia minuta TaxID=2931930 RepID=UPI001CCBE408|nr:hypothetical protein [Kovacikia minuta]UBF23787.1 hypothetical protein K9N68_18685 [Kovacikia minuta CCNUW1]